MSTENEDDEDLFTILTIFAAAFWYNSLRNRSILTRSAILKPPSSPWAQVLHYGDDRSFLELTGLSRLSFYELRSLIFGAELNDPQVGRRKSLDTAGELGLYLFYVGSQMRTKHLCLIFGVVPTTANQTIMKVMSLICRKLRRHPASAIEFPDEEKMNYFANMVHSREPLIKNVIGFVDGLSLACQCSDNQLLQNAAYNGYSHDTSCNNVFAFSPEGKVMYCAYNYPGSWHDSTVAQQLINVVINKIGTYALCVDQGFPRSGDLLDRFVGPMSKKMKKKLAPALAEYLLPLHEKYISLRQASEWGMRALQGSFSRLKSRLPSNAEKRGRIILSIILLHNFRTHYVGLNQIVTFVVRIEGRSIEWRC